MSDRKIFNVRLTALQCALIADALAVTAKNADTSADAAEPELLRDCFASLARSTDDDLLEPSLNDFADDLFGDNAS